MQRFLPLEDESPTHDVRRSAVIARVNQRRLDRPLRAEQQP